MLKSHWPEVCTDYFIPFVSLKNKYPAIYLIRHQGSFAAYFLVFNLLPLRCHSLFITNLYLSQH